MSKIYEAMYNEGEVDISLVDLLTGPKSALVFQADPSVDVVRIVEQSRVAYELPLLGLNLGASDQRSRFLELRDSDVTKNFPSYYIDPWNKKLFKTKGNIMSNTDHANDWFVYHDTKEQALGEFIKVCYDILPLNHESKEYGEYLDEVDRADREFEEKVERGWKK